MTSLYDFHVKVSVKTEYIHDVNRVYASNRDVYRCLGKNKKVIQCFYYPSLVLVKPRKNRPA